MSVYSTTILSFKLAIHSITIAFFAASLATIIGTLTAIALYRYRFRGKQAISGMLFIVMMSPDIVMAVSLLALFMIVGISLGFWSLLLAHVTFCLPYVVVSVFSRLKGFDNKMLEAAKDLGAGGSNNTTQDHFTVSVACHCFRLAT